MVTSTKGSRGTKISFHDGNTARTGIIQAFGIDPVAMAEDMMEQAGKEPRFAKSNVFPSATVQKSKSGIIVTGEGGNSDAVISKMVDAVLPHKEPATAALTVEAA